MIEQKNVIYPENGELPNVYGLPKDHKDGKEYRPMANGNIGPLANTSNLLSLILPKYLDCVKTKLGLNGCKSTEEIIANFVDYNDRVEASPNKHNKKFIASMDIKSLFPSLRTEDSVKLVRETISTHY